MFLVRLCLFVCVNLFLYAKCSIPVEKLCVNPTCEEPISKAKGTITYIPPSDEVLGFKIGQEITITSKSKNAKDYWGAVINGKSGYVPSHLVKEMKILHTINDLIPVKVEKAQQDPPVSEESPPQKKNLSDQIPARKDELENSNLQQPTDSVVGIPSSPKASNTIENPIKPDKPFKIIEGTTIYSDETDEITPSSTIDMKSAGQTIDPMSSNIISKENAQERATIPPELIKLNSNYKGQSIQNETNFNVENVEENDENAIVESKDIDNDDEEDDDEEGVGDDEEDDEDQDDDLGDEVLENYDDQIPENHIDKTKESSNVVTSDRRNGNTAGDGNSEETTPPSPHSVIENTVESTEQTVVNVVENSVTSEVNAKVDGSRIQMQSVAETLTQPLGVSEAKMADQSHPTTMSMLNGHRKLNVLDQAAAGSFQIKYGTPQSVVSEISEGQLPTLGSQSMPSEPHTKSIPLESQTTTPKPESQSIPLESQSTPPKPESQSILPESPSMPPEPQTQAIPLESQTTTPKPESQSVPPEPQSVPPELNTKHEASPAIQQLTAQETDKGDSAFGQLTTAASSGTVQNTTDEPIQILHSVTEPVTQDVPAGTFQTLQAVASEGSTIFSQFSVSADSFPGESSNNVENPSLTHEIIQDAVGVTTETLATTSQQIPAETATSSESWKNLNLPDKVTSETVQETVQMAAEASSTPSALPQVAKEELAVVEEAKAPEQGSEEGGDSVANVPEEPGMFSKITGMFSAWFTDAPASEEPYFPDTPSEGKRKQNLNELPPERCGNGEPGPDCKDSSAEEQTSLWSSWIPSGFGMESIVTSSNTFAYLVVTAVTVLLFTLGHNFIEKRGKTGPLIAKINKLEHELLISSKECLLLKDDIQSLREKIALYENSANDELVLSLQAELQESKRARSELESSIEVLQQELDAATEAGLDLNKMLSEVLTQKGGSESLLKSVESLQAQLDSQQRVIDEMTKKLYVKNQENEALQTALETANEKSESLEEQLSDIKHNLNLHLKEKEDLTKELNSQINQLKTRINQLGESKEKDISRLKKELEEAQRKFSESGSALTVKEEELKALKESVKHLRGKGDVKLDTVFDFSRVKGELAKEAKENQTLREKLQEEEGSKRVLAEQMKTLDGEMQKLRKGYEEAKQKKDEAENKLEVLSTYFKEKETQLQKELGLQEALWAQKKGDEKAVYNMMKSLQEEVESYKSQNETLKKEILDQERGLKNQIATLEQKAHENWVAARQAERKLEESKQEMAQLRNRLTLMEKNSSNVEGKGNLRSSEELNGVEAASPILHDTSSPLLFPPPLPLDPSSSSLLPPGFIPPPMFMPPPMGGFIPPPPFLPGDRRPPPLGRMSSPPLNNRFSPSSPADYPFERMSSPPLSPPGSNYRSPNEDRDHYRHRTPPYPPPLHPRNWDDSNEMPGFIPISSQRDSRRDHKGSNVSSEHSSSESLDKSSRHSGRV